MGRYRHSCNLFGVFEIQIVAKFVIEGRLPGLNEIVGASRTNRFAGAHQKKKETVRVCQSILLQNVPAFIKPITIHFDWYEPNMKRDVGNIRAGEKFISDALVAMKIIKNDTQQWVVGMSDTFNLDRLRPRVEVTLSDQTSRPS